MFCTRVVWACLVYLLLCKEEGASPVSAITERGDIVLYEVPLSMSLLGCGRGTMLTNFHMCWYYVGVKSKMFSLSGHCELLFLLCFIGSELW